MKVKASLVLTMALAKIKACEHSFACAAIQDAEVDLRYQHNDNISSKAQAIFNTFKPERIKTNASIMEWWPKGAQERIDALEQSIQIAKQRND